MTSWLVTSPALTALRALDERLASSYFDTPTSFVLGAGQRDWTTTTVRGFRSFADYAKAQPVTSPWVLYDPETWTATPLIEQQHPKAYLQAFADLAHVASTKLIAAPSPDLLTIPSADCHRGPQETSSQAYLRCGIPLAASSADVFSVQSQPLQTAPDAFAAMVLGARQQRPEGTLWAGLTTLRGDSAATIIASYETVSAYVDGFWLNTDSVTAPVALTVLQELRR